MTFYREGKVNQLHSEAVYKKSRGTYKKKITTGSPATKFISPKINQSRFLWSIQIGNQNPEYSLMQFE